MFVTFEQPGHGEVVIDSTKVVNLHGYFHEGDGDRTRITFLGGTSLDVQGSIAEVVGKLNESEPEPEPDESEPDESEFAGVDG